MSIVMNFQKLIWLKFPVDCPTFNEECKKNTLKKNHTHKMKINCLKKKENKKHCEKGVKRKRKSLN